MRRINFLAAALLLPSSPALATGSFECLTSDGSGLAVRGAIGHVAGSPVVAAHLELADRTLSTVGENPALAIGRDWLDEFEFRLDLVDVQATRFEAELRVRRTGQGSAGHLVRDGRSHHVRCIFD